MPVACLDGAEEDMAPGEVEALTLSEKVPMESALASADVPEVQLAGGGTTEVTPVDVAMAWTLEPKLPAHSDIGGSASEGAPMMEGCHQPPSG